MWPPTSTKVIHYATPRSGNDFLIKGATENAKHKQQHQADRKNNGECPPITLHRKFGVRKLNREVSGHEGNWHEYKRYFCEKKRDPSKALDTERLLDGNEIEVLVLKLEGRITEADRKLRVSVPS